MVVWFGPENSHQFLAFTVGIDPKPVGIGRTATVAD